MPHKPLTVELPSALRSGTAPTGGALSPDTLEDLVREIPDEANWPAATAFLDILNVPDAGVAEELVRYAERVFSTTPKPVFDPFRALLLRYRQARFGVIPPPQFLGPAPRSRPRPQGR